MTREELVRSKEYWMVELQSNLYGVIKNFIEKTNITRTEFAQQVGVGKSYISQVLNGDFDHKISKMVELALACNKAPILNFINLDTYVENDRQKKVYEFIPVNGLKNVTYEARASSSEYVEFPAILYDRPTDYQLVDNHYA